MLDVRIGVAAEAFVAAKKFKCRHFDSQFFVELADQCLLGRFAGLEMSAEEIPMIGKWNIRLVVTQINHQPAVTVEQ